MVLSWRDVNSHTEPVCQEFTYDFSKIADEHTQVVSLVLANVQLCAMIQNDVCLVHGEMEITVTYRCSRCLTDFVERLHIPFFEQFVQNPAKLVEEDDHLHLVSADLIELDALLEEAVVLALPAHPVCSDTCAGLCPICGSNRNDQPCSCDTRVIDPRLAGLAKFFDGNEE